MSPFSPFVRNISPSVQYYSTPVRSSVCTLYVHSDCSIPKLALCVREALFEVSPKSARPIPLRTPLQCLHYILEGVLKSYIHKCPMYSWFPGIGRTQYRPGDSRWEYFQGQQKNASAQSSVRRIFATNKTLGCS